MLTDNETLVAAALLLILAASVFGGSSKHSHIVSSDSSDPSGRVFTLCGLAVGRGVRANMVGPKCRDCERVQQRRDRAGRV